TVLVRRRCLDAVGLYDISPQLNWAEDYELWMRLAYQFSVVPIRRAIAGYRIHPGNLSGDLTRRFQPENTALDLIENRFHPPEALMRRARAALNMRLFRYTRQKHYLDQARKLDPFPMRTAIYRLLFGIGGPAAVDLWFRLE